MTRVAKEFILKHNSPLLRATEMHGEKRSFFFRCAKKQRQQLKKQGNNLQLHWKNPQATRETETRAKLTKRTQPRH